jgi:hypothetical protein
MKRKAAYRDGIALFTEGEAVEGPNGEIIEILYNKQGKKSFFVELPGIPACAHGETIEEAIEDAIEKRDGEKPITDEEKQKYQAKDFKFSVRIFRKLTRACRSGVDEWLKQRGLDHSVKMTLEELRQAGGGPWAEKLENAVRREP